MKKNNSHYHVFESAVPDVKDRVKASMAYQKHVTSTEKAPRLSSIRPRFVTLAFSFAVLIFVAVLAFPKATIESSVYIEINPSLAIDLDDEDRVIGVRPLNADAETFIEGLNLSRRTHIDDALEKVVEHAVNENYLRAESPYILIGVEGQDESRREALQAHLEARVPEVAQRHMPNLEFVPGRPNNPTDEEREDAEESNISVMKLRLIQTILDQDDETYTFEELKDLSIGDLQRIIRGVDSPTHNTPGRNFIPLP